MSKDKMPDAYDVDLPEPENDATRMMEVPENLPRPHGDTAPEPPPPVRLEQAALGKQLVTHFTRMFHTDPPRVMLPEETRVIEVSKPPVQSEVFKEFLVQRRSALMVGMALLALGLLLNLIGLLAIAGQIGGGNVVFGILTFLAGGYLAFALFKAYSGWDAYQTHRPMIQIALLAYVGTLVLQAFGGGGMRAAAFGAIAVFLGVMPLMVAFATGALRAVMTTKRLFPGTDVPGWALTALGPAYAVVVGGVMLTAFRLTGNYMLLLAVVGITAAPFWLWQQRVAWRKPMTREAVDAELPRARLMFYAVGGGGGLFVLVFLLAEMPGALKMAGLGALAVFGGLSFAISVLAGDHFTNVLCEKRSTDNSQEYAHLRQQHAERVIGFELEATNEQTRQDNFLSPGGGGGGQQHGGGGQQQGGGGQQPPQQ